MFKAGNRLNLTNVLDQWKRKMKTPTGKRTEQSGNSSIGQGGGGQDKRHGSNRSKPRLGTKTPPVTIQTNQARSKAPTSNSSKKLNGVTLTDIAIEAGIQGGPSRLNTNGWPDKASSKQNNSMIRSL
jgi:hypothetical protein